MADLLGAGRQPDARAQAALPDDGPEDEEPADDEPEDEELGAAEPDAPADPLPSDVLAGCAPPAGADWPAGLSAAPAPPPESASLPDALPLSRKSVTYQPLPLS